MGLKVLARTIVQRGVCGLLHFLDRRSTATSLYFVVQDVNQSDVKSISVYSGQIFRKAWGKYVMTAA